MVSTPLTKEQHQFFTNDWRAAFPYGTTNYNDLKPEIVIDAAAKIYAAHPSLWDAVLKSIR